MSSAGADEHNAQCDHDRLLELKARFEELRTRIDSQIDGQITPLNELVITRLSELAILNAHFQEYRAAMEARLEKLNELRGQVETDRQLYLRSDVFDVRHHEILKQNQEIAGRLGNYLLADVFNVRQEEVLKRADELTARVLDLEKWQSRLLGIAGTLITVALVIGALVGRFRW
jgi:hypothetical protein